MASILIVEDEKLLGEMYQEKLSQEGFKVSLAKREESVFQFLKKEKPDLILLDILLAESNGIKILKKIKLNPRTKDIKVICFSNLDDPNIKKEAKSLGAKDYLIKTSFTPKEIVKLIKKTI